MTLILVIDNPKKPCATALNHGRDCRLYHAPNTPSALAATPLPLMGNGEFRKTSYCVMQRINMTRRINETFFSSLQQACEGKGYVPHAVPLPRKTGNSEYDSKLHHTGTEN